MKEHFFICSFISALLLLSVTLLSFYRVSVLEQAEESAALSVPSIEMAAQSSGTSAQLSNMYVQKAEENDGHAPIYVLP